MIRKNEIFRLLLNNFYFLAIQKCADFSFYFYGFSNRRKRPKKLRNSKSRLKIRNFSVHFTHFFAKKKISSKQYVQQAKQIGQSLTFLSPFLLSIPDTVNLIPDFLAFPMTGWLPFTFCVEGDRLWGSFFVVVSASL